MGARESDHAGGGGPATLSAQEREAVRLAAAGMTARESAEVMGVSASTVGTYRMRAYAKLGVSGLDELRERGRAAGLAGSPLASAVGELARVSGDVSRPVVATLCVGGACALVALGCAALAALRPDLPAHVLMTVAGTLVILAFALLVAGELCYLRARSRQRSEARRVLSARRLRAPGARGAARPRRGELNACALVRMAQGASSASIARELVIARGTVNSIRSRQYRRLGVHSVVQLARLLVVWAGEEWEREQGVCASRAATPEDATARYNAETARIIEAARGTGLAYAGMGLGALLIIVIAVVAHWVSAG